MNSGTASSAFDAVMIEMALEKIEGLIREKPDAAATAGRHAEPDTAGQERVAAVAPPLPKAPRS